MADTVTEAKAGFTTKFYNSLFEVAEGEKIKTCLQCADCSGVCPFGYLMDFPPGRMIAWMRAGILDKMLDTDSVWMCVSCYACTEVCPKNIPLTPGLMTRAKEELLLAGNIPTELQSALEFSQRYGNPLGESPRKRADWTADLDFEVPIMRKAKRPVDVLWFVGDYASYHPRVQKTTKAFAKLLHKLGIDFGILGPEENSDGDSQRLAGERGLFEMLAEKNGKAFSQYEFKEIITTDPHAYNAIKNEYPQLGIEYPVRHYTEFLTERIEEIKPLLKDNGKKKVTYHDPCYLGRANNIYDAPRTLLEAIPGVEIVEMSHTKSTSLCCGGGGGGMWLDGFQWEKGEVRLSDWRVKEAVTSGAEILAVACPYEPPRFEDSTKTVPGAEKIIVNDILELLIGAME
ncbi:MAG: (Fe-S)-binding protein [Anaerolineales bacterium]|uniref:(Fe-S)-binding protein n=1 Tax=Candidatus Desulfolinea nitratireducens TaxID=2841698 RepID=A0A8J6TIB0_9CHLR|nr:(Fe-S)-binding protein [Candidatus Desulfolinea nitratireducens]MBL6959625.1 (Fe-S)-binding protein [Anaerolineales bacterium]